MNRLLIALFAVVLAFGAHADDKTSIPAIPAQQTRSIEADLQAHKHYVNINGQEEHSPTKSKSDEIPTGGSAQCIDGSFSFSKHRSGTCSHHGGVAAWL